MLRLTMTGTGAAGGVPLYGCDCPACIRAHKDPAFERKPCGALVEWGEGRSDERLVIDAGLMDLHQRYPAGSYLGFLLTHFHVDHVQGLFHLRWGSADKIPVWCPNDTVGCADLLKHPGCLDFRPELDHGAHFSLNGLSITPLNLQHSRPTFGYLFEYKGKRIAYLTDTDGLPAETLSFLQALPPVEALVLDCSFPPGEGNNHSHLDTARLVYQALKPQKFVATHIGHQLDSWLIKHGEPDWLVVGRDGMAL